MSLPRPPISLNTPIPNQPFTSEEVYYLEGNQGHLPLGQGLYIDPRNGEFTNIEPSPYIYCTPQYSNLPPTAPPYGCNTEVNTAGVTDFTDAWRNCEEVTEFPCVDSSAVTDFSYAWAYCSNIVAFPALNTGSGENFTWSWAYTGLTSFPLLDMGNGSIFYGTWTGCYYLTEFPELDLSKGEEFNYAWGYCESLEQFPTLDVSSGVSFYGSWEGCSNLISFPPLDFSSGTDFVFAWSNCTNLAHFPAEMFDDCLATDFLGSWEACSLTQNSVDNILVSLNVAGQNNGLVVIVGGTSAAPSATGLAAKASLEGKGWTVVTN